MSQKYKIGARVKLISFHGATKPYELTKAEENYWVLVGQEGEVVCEVLKVHPAFPKKGGRALVKFDRDLSDMGLISHNEVDNSLWIFISDLEFI